MTSRCETLPVVIRRETRNGVHVKSAVVKSVIGEEMTAADVETGADVRV
jgi:hypothetical protein